MRRPLRLEGQFRRAELGERRSDAVGEAEPDRIVRIAELAAPILLAMVEKEGGEIVRAVEMAEGLDEALPPDLAEQRSVVRPCVPPGHIACQIAQPVTPFGLSLSKPFPSAPVKGRNALRPGADCLEQPAWHLTIRANGTRVSEPAGSGQDGATSAIALNSRPICSGAVSRRDRPESAVRSGSARRRGRRCPSLSSQAPCSTGPKTLHPGCPRSVAERLEIDMGSEIALAGRLERIGISMAMERLQRIPGAASHRAVIDDQRGAALRCDPCGQPGGDRQRGGRALGRRRPLADEAALGEGDGELAPVGCRY